MALAEMFSLEPKATATTSADHDSPATSSSRRSSRKAKPNRNFFELQASTLFAQKRKAAQTAVEAQPVEADTVPVRPDSDAPARQPIKTLRLNSALENANLLCQDVRQEAEGPAATQNNPIEARLPPLEKVQEQTEWQTKETDRTLREQQQCLIESIKADAIEAFNKIVSEHLSSVSAVQVDAAPEAISNPEPSKTEDSVQQLTQRLTLMSQQHSVNMARLQMLHQLHLAEIEHNHRLAMCEQRAALDLEKQTALNELLRSQEADMTRRIDAIKARQWCATCGREAFFYCCWNTAYCDARCQQKHWPAHMATCAQRGGVIGAGRR